MNSDLAIATNTSYPRFSKQLMDELFSYCGSNAEAYILNVGDYNLPGLDESVYPPTDTTVDDTVRGMLALQSMRFSYNDGIRFITTDYKSSDDFVNCAEETGKEMLEMIPQPTGTTIADARCLAINTAHEKHDAKAVGLFEPEKITGVLWMKRLGRDVLNEDIDLAVLNRVPDLRNVTYPPHQNLSETWTNLVLNQMLGDEYINSDNGNFTYDFMGGMRIIGEKGFSLFEDATTTYNLQPGEDYYGNYSHLMVPIFQAHKRGLSLREKEIGYFHPYIQTSLEIHPSRRKWYNNKRDRQRNAIITECGRTTNYDPLLIDSIKEFGQELIDTSFIRTRIFEEGLSMGRKKYL